MATNICLDCAYLGGKCIIASEEIRECNEYKFIRREINCEKNNDKPANGWKNRKRNKRRKRIFGK